MLVESEHGVSNVVERLNKLGLRCDDVPTDTLSSATAALACFPMYMVASVATWNDDSDRQWKLGDLFGAAALRDAFAIGEQESSLEIRAEHTEILHVLLSDAKPPLLVVYEYALDTLRLCLAVVDAPLRELLRVAVARMMVAVAKASGEGWIGAGGEPTDDQRKCIRLINSQLKLDESSTAAAILAELRA